MTESDAATDAADAIAALALAEPSAANDANDTSDNSEDETKPSLVSRLPFEVLAAILAQIAIDSPPRFVKTLLIGRDFWIPFDSALLWEPICRWTYPDVERGVVSADDYGGYYRLFRERPVIRHNGVYICVSRYYRDGEPNGISFYRPRLEVKYYRYFWLRADGSARSLLSNFPPRQVLSAVPTAPMIQDAMEGAWTLDPLTKALDVIVDGGKRHRDFHFEMEVASSGGKVHNKLKWRQYSSSPRGAELSHHNDSHRAALGRAVPEAPESKESYPLDNEGSFYFCKLPLPEPK